MNKLHGTGVALVTPFKNDGHIDFDAIQRLVNFVIDGGVEYLVALGTTAETATITKDEKKSILAAIKSANDNRVPMVIGIGGNNTAQVVDEIQNTDLTDFEAVLSVSPAYNKPTQEGIYQHFKKVAEASSKPVIIYNVPGRTASNIEPITVVRLANDFKNIIGIKEAKGDMVQAMRILREVPKEFMVISGDDMMALPMVLAGGAGVISVIGEGIPKEFSEMIRLGLKGKEKEAFDIQYRMMSGIDMIFEEGNPAGIKALLNKRGICGTAVRLPLVAASEGLQQRIAHFVEKL
ncbi:4-hydroxy-tetrahydrodipicolinate synthase [Sungkyunkwania multivorans]|uniref:4-hydroxy-tetrahydrodipicolinate synthase n=1 Tax=Sungkyunkwania multivorans TaxID=1173618 RepID=A0ABW3CWJ6_9FLAO